MSIISENLSNVLKEKPKTHNYKQDIVLVMREFLELLLEQAMGVLEAFTEDGTKLTWRKDGLCSGGVGRGGTERFPEAAMFK